jgi:hypothetical protein
MADGRMDPPPWARGPDESPVAHVAFLAYRDLGQGRSFVGAGQTVGKSDSLIRRWALRHRWKARAWAWDVAQSGQDEAVARRERDSAVQQLIDDASRLWRAAMAYFWSLIDRDPETGKPVFGAKFTPVVALRFCELALRVQTNLAERRDPAESDQPADPFQLSSAELTEFLGLARELTQGKEQRDEDVHQQ